MRVGRGSLFTIDRKWVEEIDQYIRDLEAVGRRVPMAMEALVQIMARVDRAFSQEMSRGPSDPQRRHPEWAWKVPVRRISSRYYQGWKLRRVAPGVWHVYNDSKEAYYIEYGIHTSAARVPRPIRRRALLRTLLWMDQTRAGERVWEFTFGPMRAHRGVGTRGSLLRSRAMNVPGL